MDTVTRRGFVAGVAASAAMGGLAAVPVMPKRKVIWSDLIHLGTRMWGSDGVNIAADEPKGPYSGFSEKLVCDDAVWRRVTDRLAASGANLVIIDVGEGLRYPSHPEIAAKGAWSPEKLSAEVKRLQSIGLQVVPKLNFATTHDMWLGVYNRMVGTQKYYEVCRDVINDVCDVFVDSKAFHIGMDEECMDQKRTFTGYGTFRDPAFYFHDVKFYASIIEKRGMRAWMWNDSMADWPKEFLSMCPKSIVQTPAYYKDLFDKEPPGDDHWYWRVRLGNMRTLSEKGFDMIITGSTCYAKDRNLFKMLVEWSEKSLDHRYILGYMNTPWKYMLPGAAGEDENMLAIDQLEEAMKGFAG